MYGERMERGVNPPPAYRQSVEERARLQRWQAPGIARVIHPKYGTVVVPCASKLAAIECAAEVWRCGWLEIKDAGVWVAEPGDKPEAVPYII